MSSTNRAAIEKVLGLALPDDTRVLLFERESGIDDMLRAKLEIPRSSFDSVAERLPVQVSAMSAGPGRLPADRGQWNPRTTPGIRSGQAQRAGGRYINIGAAETGKNIVVFIVEHGT